MQMQAKTQAGYKLLHEGVTALAAVEANGIRIDQKYLKRIKKQLRHQIEDITVELKTGKEHKDVYRQWQRRYGSNANLGSRTQFGKVLFDDLKLPKPPPKERDRDDEKEETGNYDMAREALEGLDLPFVGRWLELEKLKKTLNTYLRGIERETTPDGFLHPSFDLLFARTFRSSSSAPNFQNMPIRDPLIAQLIRQCFIARDDEHQITEHDFKGTEVNVAACYNHDPVLIEYIKDLTKDMHRDMAALCYILDIPEITKDIRYCAKNKFVFPEFYGDWFLDCAHQLWIAIERMNLKTASGVPLKKHLRRHGIRELGELDPEVDPEPGTFIHHIKQVEKNFWGKRFKVYADWKWEWNEAYLRNQFIDTYTGFRCSGLLNRKQVVNYPIQGSAFHCLLWCLIQIMKKLAKYHMRTKIIGQIHDSIVSDVVRKELRQYLEICNEVMTQELPKHWPWIIVPMNVEVDIAPPGKSWFEKGKFKLAAAA